MHYYLTPWTWNTDEPGAPTWEVSGAVGLLDLRSLPQQALAGGTPQGYAFAALPSAIPRREAIYLGDSLGTLLNRRAASTALGLGAWELVARSIVDAIWELFTQHADPTGLARWKPLGPARVMRVYLGGHGFIKGDRFHAARHTLALERRRADYQRNRELPDTLTGAAKTRWIQSLRHAGERDGSVVLTEQQARFRWLAVLERWTGHEMQELFGRKGSDLLPLLVPSKYSGDLWRLPQTTITEAFAGSSMANFTHVEPTNVNAFTEDAGVLKRLNTDAADFPATLRHDTSLSTANHYAEIVQTTQPATAGRFFGPAVRFASGAETLYHYISREQSDVNNIAKVVSGTQTTVVSGTFVRSWPGTIRLRQNASDFLEGLIDGTVRQSATDTSITGNLQVGITGHSTVATHGFGDDFAAGDLATTAKRRRVGIGAGPATRR